MEHKAKKQRKNSPNTEKRKQTLEHNLLLNNWVEEVVRMH